MDKNEKNLVLDLFGELEEERRAELEVLLERRADLRAEQDAWRRTLERYRAADLEEPPVVDYSRLEEPEAGRGTASRAPWLRLAAALLLLAGAYLIGRNSAPTVTPPTARDDAAVAGFRRSPTSERITWLDRSVRAGSREPALADTVRLTLSQDPNVNVRLAAIDALFAAPELAPPVVELGRILRDEPSAPLRLALVDWMAAARPEDWEGVLESVARRDASPLVRSRAERYMGGRS